MNETKLRSRVSKTIHKPPTENIMKTKSILTLFVALFVAVGLSSADTKRTIELFEAARLGKADEVKAAIDRGAEVNYQDENGFTPLMYAAKSGDFKTVYVLIENNADSNLKNETGTTALMLAAKYGHTQMVKYLVQKGAKASLRNDVGLMAKDYAKHYGHSLTQAYLEYASRS
ncbi:ankyrin repeat domain-containing protein [bacterium]|nr:MAG: ankyrin repeat domain-containing protein [bacterium]